MKHLKLLAIAFLCVTPLFVWADGDEENKDWKLIAQIRQRSEVDNRDFNSDTGLESFTGLRSRLGVLFTPAEDLSAFFQVQDTRFFGTETSTLFDGRADNFDLRQAYFHLKDLFSWPVDIKMGRMEVNYGPQRLIGAVGWHPIGRSFDGGILTIKGDGKSLDIFSFKEVEEFEIEDKGDRSVGGAYGNINVGDSHKVQPFIIWQISTPDSIINRFTTGFYVNGKPGNFRHELEFAYQGGSVGDLDVAAYMFAANFGYVFSDVSTKPMVSIGVDYLSGDDTLGDNDIKFFDTLYGTNHKYYGFMDYFLNIPVNTFGRGLMDLHLRSSININKSTKLALALHNFSSTEDFVGTGGETETAFGKEIDLTLTHKYNSQLGITIGASIFSPGEIFKQERGEDLSSWYYLMTTVNLK
ncbi:MAG: alginate export family protein [Calditrichia bacterium]